MPVPVPLPLPHSGRAGYEVSPWGVVESAPTPGPRCSWSTTPAPGQWLSALTDELNPAEGETAGMAIRRAEAGAAPAPRSGGLRRRSPGAGIRRHSPASLARSCSYSRVLPALAGSGDRLGPLSSSVYSVVTKGPRTPVRTEPEKGVQDGRQHAGAGARSGSGWRAAGTQGAQEARVVNRGTIVRLVGTGGSGLSAWRTARRSSSMPRGCRAIPSIACRKGRPSPSTSSRTPAVARAARRAGADRRLGPTAAPREERASEGALALRSLTSSTASST